MELIYLNEGRQDVFYEFEDVAIPLIAKASAPGTSFRRGIHG